MAIKKYGNLALGIFFLVVAVAGFAIACGFADPAITVAQTIDSRFFPKMVCVIIGIFSVLLIATSAADLKKFDAADAREDSDSKPEYGRLLATTLVFSAYVLLMDAVGFLIMTMLYLPVQMYILAPREKQTKKDILFYVVLGVVAAAVIYFSFIYGFKVMLPKGIL
jgi:putative tricarboxylic transport membrane protein